jgi:predicted nucleotidyltransferase
VGQLTSDPFLAYNRGMKTPTIPVEYHRDIETATQLLKREGCTAVYLFGSLVTGKVHQHSDIDLGITGLPPQRFFRVYSLLDRSVTNKVDLVDFDENVPFHALLTSLHEVVKLG